MCWALALAILLVDGIVLLRGNLRSQCGPAEVIRHAIDGDWRSLTNH